MTGQTKIGATWASVDATISGSPFYEIGRSLYNTFDTTLLPSASSYTITAVAGTTVTIPGHTLAVGDAFVPQVTYPVGALPTAATALQAGRTYYVKPVVPGVSVTLQKTIGSSGAGTAATSSAPAVAGLSIPVKAN